MSLRAPVATTLSYKLVANPTEVFGSQENNSFIKHAFGFIAPVLNSTSWLHRDLNILCKYEWPSIRWSWSVTDGENFHLHSCVVYSSAVLLPCDLHDLLVGDSQARRNVLLVSTSSCRSSVLIPAPWRLPTVQRPRDMRKWTSTVGWNRGSLTTHRWSIGSQHHQWIQRTGQQLFKENWNLQQGNNETI